MTTKFLDLQLYYGVGARDEFQNLCFELIQSRFPTVQAVRCDPGDGGVDIYIGDWNDPGGITVFQVKYFPSGLGDSQKDQIRKSFQRCMSNPDFVTKEWILCLPIDLNDRETVWFANWKESQNNQPAYGNVQIDWWGQGRLGYLLSDSQNVGIKDKYFQQAYFTQIREMHGMLTYLISDIATRPDEPVNAQTLRQDAKEAFLRYKVDVYNPLHKELKAIGEALEEAQKGHKPYPQLIITEENTVSAYPAMRLYATAYLQTFINWPNFKKEYLYYGALTKTAQAQMNIIQDQVTKYNLAIESVREDASAILAITLTPFITSYIQSPDYQEWLQTPSYFQPSQWKEIVKMNTSPTGTYSIRPMAEDWLRSPLETLGWILANRPDQAALEIHRYYRTRVSDLPPVKWFQDILLQAFPKHVTYEAFKFFRIAQDELFEQVSKMEEALLNILHNIQYTFEGGTPPL